MGKTGNRTEANVHIVSDDAHIVRHAELRDLFEELGTVGMVARYLKVSVATVSRHLKEAGIPVGRDFVGRMGKEIDRLQHELEDDEAKIEEQQAEIDELHAQLRRREARGRESE